MTISDDEDVSLAEFLESEVLSEVSDDQEEEKEETGENVEEEEEEKEPKIKRARFGEKGKEKAKVSEKEYYNFNCNIISSSSSNNNNNNHSKMARGAENGSFSKIPPEIFSHILKFLSSEDLIACSLVCRYLNYAASDESLWRRLYCMRWGLLPPSKKLSECAWKKLYIQNKTKLGVRRAQQTPHLEMRDEEDMVKIVRNCPPEFKEYYIQMQAAKRSQAPLPSQLKDDRTNLDKSVADQVSIWKSSRGLSDNVVTDHVCSGETCSYYQIGDAFICEKTGNVHVCDDTCREVIMDPANELLVCTISGRCFDRLLLPSETETDHDQQQGGVTDEAEPFMGSGRFARAYLLGYNCDDEKELEAALRFC